MLAFKISELPPPRDLASALLERGLLYRASARRWRINFNHKGNQKMSESKRETLREMEIRHNEERRKEDAEIAKLRREAFFARRKFELLARQEFRRMVKRYGIEWVEEHFRRIREGTEWLAAYKKSKGIE
jgi:hypothetical protein